MTRRWTGLSAVLACLTAGCAPGGERPAPSLLLVTLGGLRADHVGTYGAAAAQTPTLDGLARRGVAFEHAYAAAPISLTSDATLLTGRYPPRHGARDDGVPMADVPTIATLLGARGFTTAAFVSTTALARPSGLARGFSTYRDGAHAVDDAIAWLRAASPDRFFLWVQIEVAPAGSDVERYDAGIAAADHEMGRLLDALGPRAQTTWIVAAGDHGEAFGEHDEQAHGAALYDTTLHVPLIIAPVFSWIDRWPGGRAGARVAEPVTLADVAATVVPALGGAIVDADGIDLAPALAGRPLGDRDIYAESFAPLVEHGLPPLRALRSGPWKYIAAPRAELFAVLKDAGERTNLAAVEPSALRVLAGRLSSYSGTP